jgi:hypothetical protein
MNKLFSIARSFLSRIFHGEETDEDTGEIFDYEAEQTEQAELEDELLEEAEHADVSSDIIEEISFIEDEEEFGEVLADLEQAQEASEQLQAELEREELEEEEEVIFNFPDFVDGNTQEEIYSNLGVSDYDDLSDDEKDDYIPGWSGFENADTSADDDNRDEQEIIEEIAEAMDIPLNIAYDLGIEALMRLSNMEDEAIEQVREYDLIDPIDTGELLGYDFSMSFDNWYDFVQSETYHYITENPAWFAIDVYYDENEKLEIDIYEKRGTP